MDEQRTVGKARCWNSRPKWCKQVLQPMIVACKQQASTCGQVDQYFEPARRELLKGIKGKVGHGHYMMWVGWKSHQVSTGVGFGMWQWPLFALLPGDFCCVQSGDVGPLDSWFIGVEAGEKEKIGVVTSVVSPPLIGLARHLGHQISFEEPNTKMWPILEQNIAEVIWLGQKMSCTRYTNVCKK